MSNAKEMNLVYDGEQEEREPFAIFKDLLTSWTAADKKSFVCLFAVMVVLFFANVEGSLCGLGKAFLPVDVFSAAVLVLLPVTALALTKGLSPNLLGMYHAFLAGLVLLSHREYVLVSYLQWYGAVVASEIFCLLAFSGKRYWKTAVSSIGLTTLFVAMLLPMARIATQRMDHLYTVSPAAPIAAAAAVGLASTIIWMRFRKKETRKVS